MNQTHPQKSRGDARTEQKVVRMSVSLPSSIFEGLDNLVSSRGYVNRSQAVADILKQELIFHKRTMPDTVMAGTISLFYDEGRVGLQARVASILREHLKEVVTSLVVMLEDGKRMEVLVVQGPLPTLDRLVVKLNACRGLECGRLTLTSAVLPPLHEPGDTASSKEDSLE